MANTHCDIYSEDSSLSTGLSISSVVPDGFPGDGDALSTLSSESSRLSDTMHMSSAEDVDHASSKTVPDEKHSFPTGTKMGSFHGKAKQVDDNTAPHTTHIAYYQKTILRLQQRKKQYKKLPAHAKKRNTELEEALIQINEMYFKMVYKFHSLKRTMQAYPVFEFIEATSLGSPSTRKSVNRRADVSDTESSDTKSDSDLSSRSSEGSDRLPRRVYLPEEDEPPRAPGEERRSRRLAGRSLLGNVVSEDEETP